MSQQNDDSAVEGQESPWGRDVVARLRAMADGELGDSDRRALEQELRSSGEGARVEGSAQFERGLREAVGRVMRAEAPRAPSALRERVVLSLLDAPSHEFDSEEPLQIPTKLTASWGWLAAAAIALTVGAGLLIRGGVGMNAPQGPGAVGTQSASIINSEDAAYLVSFIKGQHDSCAMFGEKFAKKMVARTEDEAKKAAIELLSAVPHALEIGAERLAAAGYEFTGLGRCHVPGEGRSAHLIYRSKIEGAPSISLFIQEDTGALILQVDRYYTSEHAEKDGTTLSVWKKDGMIYYLFTPDLEHAAQARQLFGAPLLHASLS